MKIGYFFTSFPELDESGNPERYVGGAAVVAYHLAREMNQLGHDVEVFTTSEAWRGATRCTPFRVRYYSSISSIGNANLSFSGLVKPMFHDCDIVHAHVPSPPMDIIGYAYSLLRRVPSVITYHAEPGGAGYGSLARRAGLRLYDQSVDTLLSHADAIVSPTAEFINNSRLCSYRSRVHVVPNGINIEELRAQDTQKESRERLHIDVERPVILYLNALVPQKGPGILIQSMKEVVSEEPDVLLVIAGKGPERERLEQKVKAHGLEHNVQFEGFVEESIKPHYYNAADLFVLPSVENHESFGLTNLEAMANETPVIGTAVGGVADVIDHGRTGFVVPPDDPHALANRLSQLFDNPTQLSEMGKSSWKTAQNSKYEWENIAKQVERIYHGVLDVE